MCNCVWLNLNELLKRCQEPLDVRAFTDRQRWVQCPALLCSTPPVHLSVEWTIWTHWPELTCSCSHITKGVSFRGAHRNLKGCERHEWGKKLNLHSLGLFATRIEAAQEEKSATWSMIVLWLREVVHIPVRQRNNSAGNQINKSRSQTQTPWCTLLKHPFILIQS